MLAVLDLPASILPELPIVIRVAEFVHSICDHTAAKNVLLRWTIFVIVQSVEVVKEPEMRRLRLDQEYQYADGINPLKMLTPLCNPIAESHCAAGRLVVLAVVSKGASDSRRARQIAHFSER